MHFPSGQHRKRNNTYNCGHVEVEFAYIHTRKEKIGYNSRSTFPLLLTLLTYPTTLFPFFLLYPSHFPSEILTDSNFTDYFLARLFTPPFRSFNSTRISPRISFYLLFVFFFFHSYFTSSVLIHFPLIPFFMEFLKGSILAD